MLNEMKSSSTGDEDSAEKKDNNIQSNTPNSAFQGDSLKPQNPKRRFHFPKFLILLIGLFLLLGIMESGVYLYKNSNKSKVNFCTQEAKLCPDGVTYVSRHGPKCEFSKCPTSNNIYKNTEDQEEKTEDSKSDKNTYQALTDSWDNSYKNNEYNFTFKYPFNWTL
jgi:hypothetical protein